MTNEIITVMGRPGAVYILEYVLTHEKTHYKELLETKAVPTLNVRLKQLLKLHVIEHHFVKKVKREEWYTITKKGEKVLQLIKKLQQYNIKILRVLSLTGTVYILEYVLTHEKTQYKELNRELVPHTLNTRLQELLQYNLIEHHFVRKDTRKEWYEITEKGKKVFQLMQKLQKITINSVLD